MGFRSTSRSQIGNRMKDGKRMRDNEKTTSTLTVYWLVVEDASA